MNEGVVDRGVCRGNGKENQVTNRDRVKEMLGV